MKYTVHKADSRGVANHGWLKSHHSFSFAHYYNPDRIHFGALRVLNDDEVAAGRGFGTHSHDNMEIISIPLEGNLVHKDSMGNSTTIRKGEIQVMSAGTGVAHSEFNGSNSEPVKFLQIWVIPNAQNVKPRYDQVELSELVKENEFSQILSPNPEDKGVWIHQNAWFHYGKFTSRQLSEYNLQSGRNGVYVFVLEGGCRIGQETLGRRDAIAIEDAEAINLEVNENSEILLMEVPMLN